MSQTETSETEDIDPDRESPNQGALEHHPPYEDPAVSPAEGHNEPTYTPPVPTVAHHAAPKPAAARERGSGVKLAKISRVGDQLFRGAAGGAGVVIVALVVFVGVFLLWLALPSLRQNTANFLTSRTWVAVRPRRRAAAPSFALASGFIEAPAVRSAGVCVGAE